MTQEHKARPILAWVALVLVAAVAELLTVANRSTWKDPSDAVGLGISFVLTYGVAGALILYRRPGNPVGRVFFYVTTAVVVTQLTSEYAIYTYVVARADLPLRELAAWVANWSFYTAFPSGVAMIFLFFPDGMPRGRKWRGVLVLGILGGSLLTLGFLLAQGPLNAGDHGNGAFPLPVRNPTGLLSDPDNGPAGAVQAIGWLVSGVTLILSVAAIVIRLFRERGERREQLKWVAYFAAPVAPAFAFHFIDVGVLNGALPDVAKPVYLAIFLVGIPAAMAISILKYHLYDIDLVISRTLVYAALAGFITLIYVAIVVGVGSLLGGGNRPNLLLSIVATATVAGAFQPLRERLQKLANRLVYGKRATPYEVLADFSGRVAETYSADDVLPRMARVLAEGTGAESATVWLRAGDDLRQAAAHPPTANGHHSLAVTGQLLPELPGPARAVAVRHQGELLGALAVSKRGGESLTPIEEKLLQDLALQAGLVLKNVGLTSALQARLDDLRASRQRLVKAQDDERRKLERNLHDGAQQHLVALKVNLGLAEMRFTRDPVGAAGIITQLKADADEALETLRDLARGIYPPLLADKGLAVALESQARKATLPVTVQAGAIGRYPQEVEAAVYFCCLEALQNVQKYAGARQATVRLDEHDGALRFEVEDDGSGFDPSRVARGAGLANMADRLDALGGGMEVESAPGRGTRLHGWLAAAPLPALMAVVR